MSMDTGNSRFQEKNKTSNISGLAVSTRLSPRISHNEVREKFGILGVKI